MVGLVLAIMTTRVKPPAAAAKAPVWMSLWVWPGSRKCTCTSIKPGCHNQTSSIKDFLSIRWEVFSDLYDFLSFDTKITDLIQTCLGIHYANPFLMTTIAFSFIHKNLHATLTSGRRHSENIAEKEGFILQQPLDKGVVPFPGWFWEDLIIRYPLQCPFVTLDEFPSKSVTLKT